jgi:hypothetical protein
MKQTRTSRILESLALRSMLLILGAWAFTRRSSVKQKWIFFQQRRTKKVGLYRVWSWNMNFFKNL